MCFCLMQGRQGLGVCRLVWILPSLPPGALWWCILRGVFLTCLLPAGVKPGHAPPAVPPTPGAAGPVPLPGPQHGLLARGLSQGPSELPLRRGPRTAFESALASTPFPPVSSCFPGAPSRSLSSRGEGLSLTGHVASHRPLSACCRCRCRQHWEWDFF